ncbi:MAG: hypothetical protein KC492_29350, partial [Myxococcales bacterium]|nr:hypothetical protein [Myxococcales bacterium]
MPSLNEAIARAVIEKDDAFARFERFANDLVAELEGGAPVLVTSSSWDLGRDGRGKGPTGTLFCCCSLTDEVDDKSEADLRRLAENAPKIDRVYFCSNQRLSEHRCNKIAAHLQGLLPDTAGVEVFGSLQLADLTRTHTAPLEAHYAAEVADCRAALRADREESRS